MSDEWERFVGLIEERRKLTIINHECYVFPRPLAGKTTAVIPHTSRPRELVSGIEAYLKGWDFDGERLSRALCPKVRCTLRIADRISPECDYPHFFEGRFQFGGWVRQRAFDVEADFEFTGFPAYRFYGVGACCEVPWAKGAVNPATGRPWGEPWPERAPVEVDGVIVAWTNWPEEPR